MRRGLPFATLVDLRKAYHCVTWAVLPFMMDDALPTGLNNICRPLLSPMKLKKRQKSSNCICPRCRIPQGDPPSPPLFNIFMDGVILQLNGNPSYDMVSLFVDDVLALARSVDDLQAVLDSCVKCSKSV